MSILAYVGLPGSGKSYSVVANQILPALKAGRTVVTNIPLHEEKIREQITTGEIREFPTDQVAAQPELIDDYAPHGCLLIIDELWKLFPAGQKVNHVPDAYKKLLAEHRHMVDEQGRSTQIVFVTQDLAQIGAFARQLVEQTFLHKKLGELGMDGSYQCRIFHGCVTGQSPPKSMELRTVLGRYEKRIYELYVSNTMSKSGVGGAQEKAVDTRGNIWKRPAWLIGGGCCLVVGFWSVRTLGAMFSPEPPVVSAQAPGRGATPLAAAISNRSAAPVVPPKSYRVSMVLQSSQVEHSYALLVDDQGAKVWVPAGNCMFDRMQWRCRYENKWWTLSGVYREPQEDKRPMFGEVMTLSAGAGS